MHKAPSAALAITTPTEPHRLKFDRSAVGEEPELDVVVLPCGSGVAIGVAGAYVTPLAVAATSKTDPPPYS